MCPCQQPLINLVKILEDRPRLFLTFFDIIISAENSQHSLSSDSTNLLLMSYSEDLFLAIFNGKLLTLNTHQ